MFYALFDFEFKNRRASARESDGTKRNNEETNFMLFVVGPFLSLRSSVSFIRTHVDIAINFTF